MRILSSLSPKTSRAITPQNGVIIQNRSIHPKALRPRLDAILIGRITHSQMTKNSIPSIMNVVKNDMLIRYIINIQLIYVRIM